MERLDCPVQGYAWGSVSALPALLARPETGDPQAELWMGTHPRGPARVIGDSGVAGPLLSEVVGSRLPYLMKILAAARPLSIQAHPTKAQAVAGFALENEAGIAIDAIERTYRDDNHKPELICAITPFAALCGFRSPDESAALFRALDVPGLAGVIAVLTGSGTSAERIRLALTLLLRLGPEEATALTARVAAACARPGASFVEARAWAVRCAEQYGEGAGVVTSLLLNFIELQPGEALYLGAGNLHAYLEGVGVEIMAESDNVLRGGMTNKHIDIDGLLAVVDCEPGAPVVQTATAPITRYECDAPDFGLTRVAPQSTDQRHLRSGEVVLSLGGQTVLRSGDHELRLDQGQVAWVPVQHKSYSVSTSDGATAFVASTGH